MTEINLGALKAWPQGHAGFVVICGRPNVGKSTFLNSVLDFHLCAVSAKPQTTRRTWRGVLSDDDTQIVFLDTPGAHIGNTKLGEYMLEVVMTGLRDADVILCVADPSREPGNEDELVAMRVAKAKKSTILLLNKCDVTTKKQREETKEFFLKHLGKDTPVFEIVAMDRKKLDPVLALVRKQLPAGPFFYDPEDMTDAITRDIGAEMIREAALHLLHEEIPHAIAVEICKWEERPGKVRIEATLHVERKSQKSIVIGKDGTMIGQIRRDAIKPLAELCDGRVDLRLFVKVSDDWRNRKNFLTNMGLTEK